MQIWASYTLPLEEDTDEQAAHHKEIKYKHPFNGHMQWNLTLTEAALIGDQGRKQTDYRYVFI